MATVRVSLFPNEYHELLALAPDAAQYAVRGEHGWTLDLPDAARDRLATLAEQAVVRTERQWQEMGRQIWLTRPQMTDEEYARREAEHGDAERRHRVLSRVIAALLDAGRAG